MYDPENDAEEESSRANKSQLKREAHALFELGKRLVELEISTLKSLELPEEILHTIIDTKQINSNHARKRQFKLIGKYLRSIDTTELVQLIEKRDLQHQKGVSEFHHIEKWRDRLIGEGTPAMSEFLDKHPDVDRQQLNQLVRGAVKELQAERPLKSARMLFRYLRDIVK
ncbi:MAG: ribosome biogenesis factor YjgA [Mariprofundaceae bacterium]